MDTRKIQDKIEQYKKAVEQVQLAKEKWQQETKDFITATLNTIRSEVDSDLEVVIDNDKINNETIKLTFKDKPSGIEYNPASAHNKKEKLKGPLIKHGGTLNFTLIDNGLVLNWLTYPYIPTVFEQSEIRVLGTFQLDELDDQTIANQVEIFIEEMIEWETSSQSEWTNVGFKVGQQDK